MGFAWQLRQVIRRRCRPRVAFVTLTLVSVLLVAAMSMGEARYRIPFDGCLIILAAGAYLSRMNAPERAARATSRSLKWAVGAWGALTVTVYGVAAIAHPDVQLLARATSNQRLPVPVGERIQLSQMASSATDGASWLEDAHVIKCGHRCKELRVDLRRPRKARRVHLAADHGDWYRISFYLEEELVGSVDALPVAGPGIQTRSLSVPDSARQAKFDSVGVAPLYGDGRYSVAALRLSGARAERD
jgi:hypothetical protein